MKHINKHATLALHVLPQDCQCSEVYKQNWKPGWQREDLGLYERMGRKEFWLRNLLRFVKLNRALTQAQGGERTYMSSQVKASGSYGLKIIQESNNWILVFTWSFCSPIRAIILCVHSLTPTSGKFAPSVGNKEALEDCKNLWNGWNIINTQEFMALAL